MSKLPHGERFLPKLYYSLQNYTGAQLTSDVIAGLTVGVVALPLAMAFAIASGVKPEAGIYTAILAGFIVSAFGGSRCQIAGPTGAFVVIVAGIVAKDTGVAGLLICTGMAGIMLLIMGLTGLGSAIRFIPRPVTIGFTNGIAVLIASTQIKEFLGLGIERVPSEFLERMEVIAENIATVNWSATALACITLAIILFWPRLTRRIPGTIVALILTTILGAILPISIETIQTRFGGIPTGLPEIAIPAFSLDLARTMLPSAVTVAMLAAIESLLSAVVADTMSGDKHNPNVELTAQGVANILLPLVGGIPATGAIARTATNIRSGAKTPVAGIVHAVVLLVILLVAAPLAAYIPLATLAAVLFIVAYNMGEWREIPGILRLSNVDRIVWFATFALTVFADLTVAVEVGMVMAALLYIYQVSETTSVAPVTPQYLQDGKPHVLQDKHIPDYVTILRIHGPFLFGATSKLEDVTHDISGFGPIVILRLRNMTALDATGLHAIESLYEKVRLSGRHMLICGARRQPAKLLKQSQFLHHIGEQNVLPHVDAALQRAKEVYAANETKKGTQEMIA